MDSFGLRIINLKIIKERSDYSTNRKMAYPLNYGLSKSKLPLIFVEVNGKHLCFIIDTGSTCCLIDSNVAEYFKDIVTPVGDYNISGIGGTKHKVDVLF